jgi:mannose-6-phosphate isomerase
LLARWGRARGRPDAVAAAGRLYDVGAEHGIDPLRGVAVNALGPRFAVTDATARLWPQTEWLRASLMWAGLAENPEERTRYEAQAAAAASALLKYLDVPTSGVWRDKLRADGSFADEPAPASSFYHIVGALVELNGWVRGTAEGSAAVRRVEVR